MKNALLFFSALTFSQCCGTLTEWGVFRAEYIAESDSYHIRCIDETYDVGMLVIGAGFSSTVEYDNGVKRITFSDLISLAVPQTWIIASADERISANMMNALENDHCLLRMDDSSIEIVGSSTIELELNTDIYLAFVCRDDPYFAGNFYYGWLRFDGENVLGYNYDVGDGVMVVGGGAWEGGIPEPSGGVLFLLGAATLGLRRKSPRRCADFQP